MRINVGLVITGVKRHIKLLSGIVAGLVVGGGWSAVVLASIPDASGVIHACYTTAVGAVRIIDSPSQSCNALETAITWNQAGPQGTQGATGPQGPTGPSGPSGPGGFIANLVGADFTGAGLQYRNLATIDMQEARQSLEHGRLSRTIGTDDGDDLTRSHLEAHAMHDRQAGHITCDHAARGIEAGCSAGPSGRASRRTCSRSDPDRQSDGRAARSLLPFRKA